MARAAWKHGIEWSATNGRPCDLQLIALRFDEKSGQFSVLGAKAKNVPDEEGNPGLHSDLAGQGESRILAWVIVQQETALRRAHERGDAVYGNLEKLLGGLQHGMQLAFDLFERAMKERESFAGIAAQERKEQREFVKELTREFARGEAINRAIDQFGPLAEELARDWLERDNGGSAVPIWSKKAGDLIASITAEQKAKAGELGFGDVIQNAIDVLTQIKNETDRDKAKALVLALGKELVAVKDVREQIFTNDQALLVRGLLKFAGVPI
jgi:hypothetical protein